MQMTAYFYTGKQHDKESSIVEFTSTRESFMQEVAKMPAFKKCCCYQVCDVNDIIVAYMDCGGKK